MTRQRFASIRLPAGMSPCEPAGCVVPLSFVRYVGTPTGKDQVKDYSAEHPGGTVMCEQRITLREWMARR